MKTIHTTSSRFKSIMDNLELAGRAGWRMAKTGSRLLTRMPWPILLVVAVVLAALLTIVPIVLALFVGLLLLKFLAVMLFGGESRSITPYQPHDPQSRSE